MKSQTMVKSKKQKKPRGDIVSLDQRFVRVSMDNISSQRTIVVRKLCSIGTVSTAATGYIAAAQIDSDGARGVNGWSDFQARYLQFRVKAIRVRLFPLVDVNTAVTAGGGAVTPHPGPICFAKFMEGLGYANIAALVDGQERMVYTGCEKVMTYGVDWTNVPEAHLWSATNAAMPSAQRFGIQYQDFANGPASAVTTVYYRILTEYLVEFQTPA